MPDIILINDQGQEQALSGVSKLITRGPDGEVEFSAGGGSSTQSDMLVYFDKVPNINGTTVSIIGKTYTSSPATGYLTVDIPQHVEVLAFNPKGYLVCTVINSDTGNVVTQKSIENFTVEKVEKADGTTRLQCAFSVDWDGGTSMRLGVRSCYLAIDGMYAGATITKDNGKYTLSGENAGAFRSNLWSATRYGYINIYDFSEDLNTPVSIAVRDLLSLEEMYFSSAGIADMSSALASIALYGCVNIKILDFSKCTTIQTFPYPLSGYADEYLNDYKVKVPSSLYAEWVAATGWKDIASHIVAV